MISRQVCMPFMGGMITSMTMTCGFSLPAAPMAASPSEGNPTTWMRSDVSRHPASHAS